LWGNPQLVRFIERFAENAKKIGWNGLLVGDMSQPRGGPMPSNHKSHQVGLDVDIWFTPMPDHVQSRTEREFGSATDVVAPDMLDVDLEVWTHKHTELIRTAAQDPAVTRILVNAAIKKALHGCDHELDFWFKDSALHPPTPPKPKPALTLAGLPPECKQIVKAP
jgi:penicillin-insensitive murein endopeptidase